MKKYERIVEKLEATLKYNTTDGSDGSYNTTMMAVTAMVAGRQQGASEHHFLWGEYLRCAAAARRLCSETQTQTSINAWRRPTSASSRRTPPSWSGTVAPSAAACQLTEDLM